MKKLFALILLLGFAIVNCPAPIYYNYYTTNAAPVVGSATNGIQISGGVGTNTTLYGLTVINPAVPWPGNVTNNIRPASITNSGEAYFGSDVTIFGTSIVGGIDSSGAISTTDALEVDGDALFGGAIRGNGSGISNVVARFVSGTLSNSITGNAATATSAANATNNYGNSSTATLATNLVAGVTVNPVNGSAITSLTATALSSGTVPTARLGSGTANNTTYLRGDNTWATPAGGSGGSASNTFWTVTDNPTIWTNEFGGQFSTSDGNVVLRLGTNTNFELTDTENGVSSIPGGMWIDNSSATPLSYFVGDTTSLAVENFPTQGGLVGPGGIKMSDGLFTGNIRIIGDMTVDGATSFGTLGADNFYATNLFSGLTNATGLATDANGKLVAGTGSGDSFWFTNGAAASSISNNYVTKIGNTLYMDKSQIGATGTRIYDLASFSQSFSIAGVSGHGYAIEPGATIAGSANSILMRYDLVDGGFMFSTLAVGAPSTTLTNIKAANGKFSGSVTASNGIYAGTNSGFSVDAGGNVTASNLVVNGSADYQTMNVTNFSVASPWNAVNATNIQASNVVGLVSGGYSNITESGYVTIVRSNLTMIGELTQTNGPGINTRIGVGNMTAIISGSNNVAVGYQNLRIVTNGIGNVAQGYLNAYYATSIGDGNSLQGYNNAFSATSIGDGNSLQGYFNAFSATSIGSGNSLQGYLNAYYATSIGSGNSLQGCLNAFSATSIGSGNSLQGYNNAYYATSIGDGNSLQGYNNAFSATSIGNGNSLQGYNNAFSATSIGNGNILLGMRSESPYGGTLNGILNIGSLIFGTNMNTADVASYGPSGGKVGINTTNLTATLNVGGDLKVSTTITASNSISVAGTGLSALSIGAASATGGTNYLEVVGLATNKVLQFGTNGNLSVSGTATATNGVFGASGSLILSTNVSIAMAANTYTNVLFGVADYSKVFGGITAGADSLTNAVAGNYYVSINASFTGAGASGSYEGAVFTNNVECSVIEWVQDVAATTESANFSGIITLPANCRIDYRIKHVDAETAVFKKVGLTVMGAN